MVSVDVKHHAYYYLQKVLLLFLSLCDIPVGVPGVILCCFDDVNIQLLTPSAVSLPLLDRGSPVCKMNILSIFSNAPLLP